MEEGMSSVPPAAPPPPPPTAPSSPPAPAAAPPPPPKKKSYTWVIIVIAVILLLCGCVCVGGYFAARAGLFAAKKATTNTLEELKKEGEKQGEEINKIKDQTTIYACQANLKAIDAAIQAYYAQKQTYPVSMSELKDAGLLVLDIKCPLNQASYTIDPVTNKAVCPNGHTY
jgi:hypothetical protein